LGSDRKQRGFAHVAVIGPGAIGCVFAVRLALAEGGPRVTLVDHRAGRAERLSARSLVLHAPEGDLSACLPVRTALDEPPDLVILATKAYAVRSAARAAAAWMGRAPILTIQNGLGARDETAEAAPASTVITGVIYQAANVVSEGEVNHVANQQALIGYPGRPPDDLAKAVAALLDAAGLPARTEADMTPVVWGKLLINAALNSVAALAGVRNGEVASRPALRALAEAIAEEGAAAARAEGVRLPYTSAAEATFETARMTAENRCSMLQDLEAGRRTEIDYLNGVIVRAAEAHGIAAPANRAAVTLIRQASDAEEERHE